MKYLILLILLNGCGKFYLKHEFYENMEFREYTNDYLSDKFKYQNKYEIDYPISIEFDELEGTKVGTCTYYKYNPRALRKIHIDISYWKRSSYCQRKVLLYHELGHCDLDLDHIDDYPDIMNSNIGQIKHKFCQNPEPYIKELFK